MSKVIWYLLHYASTPKKGTRNRPFYLAKSFKEMGNHPYVIAANFHHYLKKEIPVEGALSLDESEEVPFIWLKTPRYHENGFKRVINMFYYGFALWRHAEKIKKITGNPDVIIVSSPHSFCFPMAARLAKKYHAKLIFEARDLWPMALIQVNKKLRFNPLIIFMGWIEKMACKKADLVVSVLPNALSYLKTKGLDEHRFAYIPNGFGVVDDQGNLENCSTQVRETVDALKKQGKFLIGYLGTHGVFNALEQLVDALTLLQKNGNKTIHAVLIGDGVKKEALKEKSRALTNITFFDGIPASEAQSFLRMMDALFIGWHPLPIYDFGISPDKIFQYMLAGKPIIHAIGTPHDPTQMAGCAYVVKPNAPDALAKVLEEVGYIAKDELKNKGLKGREYVLREHDYKVLARKYSVLFTMEAKLDYNFLYPMKYRCNVFAREESYWNDSYGNDINARNSKIVVFGIPKSGNTYLVKLLSDALLLPIIDPISDIDDRGVGMSHRKFSNSISDRTDIKHAVVMIRDIRDIIASFFNYSQTPFFRKARPEFHYDDIESFYYDWYLPRIDGTLDPCNYSDQFSKLGLPVIRYEKLIEDPQNQIVKLLNIFGLKYNENNIIDAVEKNSFKKLQSTGMEFGNNHVPSTHFNMGTRNRYNHVLTKKILNDIYKRYEYYFDRWGYEKGNES